MFVSFDTKVRYKGREYSRLADIPADERAPLERALHRLCPTGMPTPQLNSRILINGRTVTDPATLSAAQRDYIQSLLSAMFPIENAVCLAAVRERRNFIGGVIGLSFILSCVLGAAAVLWMRGYFG